MKNNNISLAQTGKFSSMIDDYLNKRAIIEPFYNLFPNIENFQEQINNKKINKDVREDLVKTLIDQYQEIEEIPIVQINSLLDENTFTVTTGHQLNLLTGPLYFIFKIITVVEMAKRLKIEYPKYNFVPIYWMATEDHDFEEINFFHLFSKKYEWNAKNIGGAVGEMSTEGIEELLDEIKELPDEVKKAYSNHANLADATRYLVHYLFKSTDLVVLDANTPILKKYLLPVVEKEFIDQTAYHKVQECNQKLVEKGYKAQAFAREINFFWLEDKYRVRLEKKGDEIVTVDGKYKWSLPDFESLTKKNPEKISPNVIIRPLYQELVLPNLAYIGGPGELAYWFQLKGVFEGYKTSFPMLIPRNFGGIIQGKQHQYWEEEGLLLTDYFMEESVLKKKILTKYNLCPFNMENSYFTINALFDSLSSKVEDVDKSLLAVLEGEKKKILKSLNNIEKKVTKAEERTFEQKINKILRIQQKISPQGGLQERHDNIFTYFINNPKIIQNISEIFDPFDFRFNLMIK